MPERPECEGLVYVRLHILWIQKTFYLSELSRLFGFSHDFLCLISIVKSIIVEIIQKISELSQYLCSKMHAYEMDLAYS